MGAPHGALQPKPAANFAHKPECSVGVAAIEERLIELRENAQPSWVEPDVRADAQLSGYGGGYSPPLGLTHCRKR